MGVPVKPVHRNHPQPICRLADAKTKPVFPGALLPRAAGGVLLLMASAFLPRVLQRLYLSQAASEDLLLTKFPECTAGSAVLKIQALEFPST